VLQVGDGLMKSMARELGWSFPELNIQLLNAGVTHPQMVRALRAFQARLCTTLFADLTSPGAVASCTCRHRQGSLFEALSGVAAALIEHYAEGAREITLPERGAGVLRRAKDYLHAHYKDPYSLEQLAAESGCGKFYLSHAFKREFGLSPSQYRSRVLVSKACELLMRYPDWSLDQIAMEVGWPSRSHARSDRSTVLIRHFKRVLGTTPRRFRASLTLETPDGLGLPVARPPRGQKEQFDPIPSGGAVIPQS
jgi:AraC-like DNA-binding protein